MIHNNDDKTYTISSIDMMIILGALEYQHWNDRELTEEERDRIDGLFQSFDNS